MRPEEDWESFALSHPEFITYQLLITLTSPRLISVGRLGDCEFSAGTYQYTGSARRNLVSRIRRHLSKKKTLRWHIDYLLAVSEAQVVEILFSDQSECKLNQQCDGTVVMPGFGASDCRAGCGSHLKYLGEIN